MADRFYRNEMPAILEESVKQAEAAREAGDLHLYRLRLPYPSVAPTLLRAGLQIADDWVVPEACRRDDDPQFVPDYTLWTGKLGAAYLLLKSHQVRASRSDFSFLSSRPNDLEQCVSIARMCYQESVMMKDSVPMWSCDISFICGRAGVCAIGAVAAKYLGDMATMNFFLSAFGSIRIPSGASSELLQGKAGYLWTCLFLSKHLGCHTISSTYMNSIAKKLISEGRSNPNRGDCPLMYEHCGMNYYGASRGVAGILHVLMDMHLTMEEQKYVKGTLKYIIWHRLPSGNYPKMKQSKDDELVHWCHGAPGIALTLIKAYQVFQDREFLTAAQEAAEVVWKRGLLKRVGLCHGVSGNTYVFLALYRATGTVEYLYKAKAFASFILTKAPLLVEGKKMGTSDEPASLFEGVGGMAYLFLDMVNPAESRFPGYEL